MADSRSLDDVAEIQASNGHIHRLTDEEAHRLFDKRARNRLKISGEEFIARWDRGDFDCDLDRPAVMSVAMLLPLVRE